MCLSGIAVLSAVFSRRRLSFSQLFQSRRQIVTDTDKQPHNGNVVRQKQHQRFLKIKEYKLVAQQHIAADVPLDKCIAILFFIIQRSFALCLHLFFPEPNRVVEPSLGGCARSDTESVPEAGIVMKLAVDADGF